MGNVDAVGCLVCDDLSAPLNVKRVCGVISSFGNLNELMVSETYLKLLQSGVLSSLHSEVRGMIFDGVDEGSLVAYVDEALAAVLGGSSSFANRVDDYSDGWDDSDGSDQFDEYSDDWF